MNVEKALLQLLLFGAIVSCLVVESADVNGKRQPHKKVLILGAGLSGIIAGKTLTDNGVNDFLILEGQDYIGGRIRQESIAGYNIEAGANWIHFAKDGNTVPIWNLKKATNLTGVYSDYTDIIIRNQTGANITDMESLHRLEKIFKNVDSKQEERKKARKSPIPSRVGLALMGWKPRTSAEKLIEYLEVDFEFGKRAELVPFQELFASPSHEYFITDQRGVFTLYKGLYKKFEDKIKLQKTVTEVKYNSSTVEVTTSDGEVYSADFVLCTFSTGVLESDMVKFDPPFPEWKQEAILKLPLAVYTKIFLKFPFKFWDDNEYILVANQKIRGYYPVFQDLDRKGMYPKGSGMLLITVTEDEGRRIEKQSFAETKAEIVKMLRGVYGQNVSEPTDIYYHRWTLNPYIRGAYSNGVVGVSSKDRENLAENLGHLYFSGEATSEDWSGFMQGAYLTGEKKAKAIASIIKCKEAGKKDCETPTGSANSLYSLSAVISLFFSFFFYFFLF